MGRALDFHRPVFWTVAGLGATRGRYFRDAVLAFSGREFRLCAGMGGGAATVWRRDFPDRGMAVEGCLGPAESPKNPDVSAAGCGGVDPGVFESGCPGDDR